jgi:hypothetical protein
MSMARTRSEWGIARTASGLEKERKNAVEYGWTETMVHRTV